MSTRKIAPPGIAIATGLLSGLLSSVVAGPAMAQADAGAVYFAAGLIGRNEVPAAGGPAVNDRDGRATAVIKIEGDEVSFALRWKNVGAPTAAHIHLGSAGANGAVKIGFFGTVLPGTARAVTGTVKVTDAALLASLRDNPTGFYANLHTGEFPGGAVRGQLHRLNRPVDLGGVLVGDATATLQSIGDGDQEVPAAGKKVGDPDGHAGWMVHLSTNKLNYAAMWSKIGAPTNGHLHRGPKGTNGPVAAELFGDAKGLPETITGLAGSAPVTRDIAKRIAKNPEGWYTNLHTAEFPGGAVRGQLAKATGDQPRAVNAPVLRGTQIYACTPKAGGGHAFTQLGVTARLDQGIRHSFVRPAQGPPQWIAPDGSAVTGTVISKSPNGDRNIPELVLDATQSGRHAGLLSGVTQILRLNTVGGVAPTGDCDPKRHATAKVPYQADYLFLG